MMRRVEPADGLYLKPQAFCFSFLSPFFCICIIVS